jgi:DNA mismatch endonuclease (patch repair protein)
MPLMQKYKIHFQFSISHLLSKKNSPFSDSFASMADVHDSATRSYNMSQIKGKDTKPEMLVRRYLHAQGFRYKLHDKTLPGKPDIVLPKYKTIIFVHGCFWHGHKNCKYATIPKTRTEWWTQKIDRNKELDKINTAKLRKLGWKVIILHECKLKPTAVEHTFKALLKSI